ncbi:MAG TPA: hypothetical protein PK297_02060 [Spirochaetota bacterium]|nr:hypothetical protein [Spirochaetota bacterium]
MRGKQIVFAFVLIVPVLALQGFGLQGDLTLYGSAILDGGEYAKNSAEMTFTATERIGESMIRTEVDCFWSSVHGSQPDILIREASWKHVFEVSESGLVRSLTLSAGMLRFTWGKSDELRVLDILNPQYLNFVLFDGIEERKLGRLAFGLEASLGDCTALEAVVLPLAGRTVIENQAMMPKAMRDLYAAGRIWSGFEVRETWEARQSLDDLSLALRWRDQIFGVDYGFYWYHGYHNLPVFKWTNVDFSNPADPLALILQEYRKTDMLGIDFEAALGSFVFRGEVALYVKGKTFQMGQTAAIADAMGGGDGTRAKRYLQYVIGFDNRNFLVEKLYLNLQFSQNRILEHDSVLQQDAVETIGTARVEYGFDRDIVTLKLGFGWFVSRGWQGNPEVSFKIDDGVALGIGAWLMQFEATDPMYGSFDKMDFGYITMSAKF